MFFSANNPSNTTNQTALAANTNVGAVATRAPQFELVGFDEALEELSRCSRIPSCTAANVSASTGMIGTTALAASEAWYDDLPDATKSALTIAGLNLFVNGGLQLKEYYDRHTRIQKNQHTFIEAIPTEYIDSCFYTVYTARDKKISIGAPFTAQKIIDSLNKNRHVTIKLNVGNIEFSLKNNGIFSFRLGVAAVSSFAASVIACGIFITYEIANRADPTAKEKVDEAPMRAAAMISTSVPFTKIMSQLMDACYKQELNLLKALQRVTEIYQAKKNLHKMPERFITLLRVFLSEDNMNTNLETIRLCREYYDDIESQFLRGKVKSLEDEMGMLKTKVVTLEDGRIDLQAKDQALDKKLSSISGDFKTLEQEMKEATNLLAELNEEATEQSRLLGELSQESSHHATEIAKLALK